MQSAMFRKENILNNLAILAYNLAFFAVKINFRTILNSTL